MEPQLVNIVANLGAVGFLGYFLTVTVPRLVEKLTMMNNTVIQSIIHDRALERTSGEIRYQSLNARVNDLARELPLHCRYPPNEVTKHSPMP